MTSKIIAVTGGIGSGKSEVIRYLQSLGYKTLDCDKLARKISLQSQTIKKVRDLLGDDFVCNGQLNRRAIRDKVFDDEELLQKYNSIFFGEVKKMLVDNLSRLKCIVFVEISVFDAFEFPWNEVWFVDADAEIRAERAMSRDGLTRKTLDNIMLCQKFRPSYSQRIVNNGSLRDLYNEIDTALAALK